MVGGRWWCLRCEGDADLDGGGYAAGFQPGAVVEAPEVDRDEAIGAGEEGGEDGEGDPVLTLLLPLVDQVLVIGLGGRMDGFTSAEDVAVYRESPRSQTARAGLLGVDAVRPRPARRTPAQYDCRGPGAEQPAWDRATSRRGGLDIPASSSYR